MQDNLFSQGKAAEGYDTYTPGSFDGVSYNMMPHHLSPTIILERLDREYMRFRAAIAHTLDMSRDISFAANGTGTIMPLLKNIEQRLNQLEGLMEHMLGRAPGSLRNAYTAEDASPANAQVPSHSVQNGSSRRDVAYMPGRRIRWGESDEEIRRTIFEQLDRIQKDGQPLTTESIKRFVPGMLRWLYGQQKMFDGIEALRAAYAEWKAETQVTEDEDRNAV